MTATNQLRPHASTRLVDKLDDAAYQQLKADIEANGQLVPIVMVSGHVLDGRARLKACNELKIAPKTVELKIEPGRTLDDALIGFNVARRHLETNQRALLAARYSTLKPGANQHTAGAVTQAALAKRFAVSVDSIQRAAAVLQKGIPELVTAVETGRVDLATAREVAQQAKEVQEDLRDQEAFTQDAREVLRRLKNNSLRETRLKNIETIRAANDVIGMPPTSQFNLLYADPPWDYTAEAKLGYPTMALDEIKACVTDCPRDAVLFLWVPASQLAAGLAVIEAWGFEYVTCAIWDRGSAAQGFYFRVQHEVLMFAKRGKPPLPAEDARPPSIFTARKGRHSAKPVEVYSMIESMFPELSKLELFCRGAPRDGWEGWGNECLEKILLTA